MATITTEFGKLSSKKQRAVYLLVRDKKTVKRIITGVKVDESEISPKTKKIKNFEKAQIVEKLKSELAAKLSSMAPEINYSDNMDATKIASDIVSTIRDLKRDGYDVKKLNKDVLVEIFALVDNDVIPAAKTEVIFKDACEDISPMDSVKKNNLEKLSEDTVAQGIKEIVEENKSMIEERKMGAMGPLMGKAMAKFQGKADGKIVSKILTKEIQNIIN